MFRKRNRANWRVKKTRKRPKRPFKSYEPGYLRIHDNVAELMLPRKLVSPNRLKTGLARHGDTKAWEQAISKANVVSDDGSFDMPVDYKVRLDVTRLCPREQFFLDQTNLAFSVKGLEDALVRLGYLKDDNHTWLDGPYVQQGVSTDGKYHTYVRVSKVVVAAPPKPERTTRARVQKPTPVATTKKFPDPE